MNKLILLPLVALAACAQAAAAPPPSPKVDVPAGAGLQTAVFAGGCFWGMEGVFEHVKGVRSAVSGYAGGKAGDANYETVSSETTGHAEAVKITYDPKQISYGQLLRIFFAEHDPTELNRQGPDQGTSYRSAIFPQNGAQRQAASAYIAQLNGAHAFPRRIATRIESGGFYPAEDYHQGFLRKHPDHPYIRMWDMPKLADLRKQFPNLWRA
ncbi:MAG TPA: peptide-methionine (S)-S-oxide reductase MsrA [Allosphingosinicella sp.]|jgi:peptide-methionine (S)-S-oxide reductase|nr:peptide-methionine (S)-S-oxide reductase MsrA [Allosphingosinicella sp.]